MSGPAENLGETLVPVVNRLQDIFSQVTLDFKLELPQVAVIGSQSSGKSSVLEALVGRDFLPRGPEICTRRPLVLQLVKTPASAKDKSPFGEFLHAPGKIFHDFDQIRQEILQETENMAGGNKGISDKPIRLKICSTNVLTMTLVDLPGLARVPVGDQPGDIEARIRAMITEYIKHPTCVILAVSPANVDLVNSDALEMARCVDPEGLRTLGVLTKLDIMDRGTDATSILRNDVVPLRLGHIGVVNRSQHDINTNRDMKEAISAEAAFFDSRPEYLPVASQCGTPALARALNRILVDHIRAVLPSLRVKLEDALAKRTAELTMYGSTPPGSTSAQRGALLLQLLDAYAVRYAEMLEGRSEHLPVNELAGGARIRHIFQEIFVSGLNALDPSSELSNEDIRTAIKNSGGVKGSLLIPDAPFELLVRRAIARLLTPSLQSKEFVHTELLRIAGQCAPSDIARFPALQEHLVAAVEDFINEGAAPAERMIRDLVSCEHSYINTDHPHFIGGSRAIATVMEQRQQATEASSTGADDSQTEASTPGDMPNGHSHTNGRGHLVRRGGRDVHVEQHHQDKRGLRGVEPELLQPDELLGGLPGRRPLPVSSPVKQPPKGSPQQQAHGGQAGNTTTWFSSLFKMNGERGGEGGGQAQGSLHSPPQTIRVAAGVSEQEEVQVQVTRTLVQSYFSLVRASLQDSVPKAVMHFLVLYVQRGLQQHLIRTLYKEELFEEMMGERDDVAAKRTSCQAAVAALRQAMGAVDSVPQTLLSRINSPHRSMSTNLDVPIHWRGQAIPISQPSTLGPRLHAAQPGVHF